MGLDTTHDAWRGAYSAFSRWRATLAIAAGYTDDNFYGLDHSDFENQNYQGSWGGRELPDPLLYLLVHSDCDGLIEPEHAGLIADRLTELLPNLPAGGGGGHVPDWRAATERFIAGCRAAVAANEPIEFW